jgi:hypothetical protein
MKDLEIVLDDHPGALARMGETLAAAGISIEGGGAWIAGEKGIAHFLFEDSAAARKTLEEKGIGVMAENEILVQRLRQDVPGQLGKITRLMQEAGINIKVLYSDHNNQLVLVVDDIEKGRLVSQRWTEDLNQ